MRGTVFKDTGTSEHAWLFISNRDGWQRIINSGSFGLKRYSAFLEEARPGEPCVAYVRRQKLFAGLGKITGGYYCDKTSEFPYRVQLEVRLDTDNGVPARSIISDLQFIKNKTNWQAYLQGGLKKIPLSDYQFIKSALMREEPDELTESGGRVSIPIDIIDTHTKAEGALLELGNLLGFDTYITADDRRKEFRGKLLSETATLQEIPEGSIPPDIKDTVRHIDVTWFKEKVPNYCIEVEHSTNITQALVRFSEIRGLTTKFIIVAPAEVQDKFEREIERTLFTSIRDRVRFNSYDKLAKFLAFAREFVKEKENFLCQ